MANVSSPLRLPEPKPKKKKVEIPYYKWPNRIKRWIKAAIKTAIVVTICVTIYLLATIDDVSMSVFFGVLQSIAQLFLFILTAMVSIIVQFGLLFWFLSRPKVEKIKPGDDSTVTFDDYWGQPELVKLVKQWMQLLRDRKEFEKMGGKYISGLLLYGPPGTGKTMLAKAIAGESGMAFMSAQGTSFQGMFWGMDILMVLRFSRWARDLAKKYGACVAYIDEIDAVGMNRGGVRGLGGAGVGGMASGTGMGLGMFALSTLLSQMDGMNQPTRVEKMKTRFWGMLGRRYVPKRNWHVVWMGSTNRPDVLDPALTRSGRLDTKIAVDPPDRASRRLIIEGYLKKIQHDDTIDVEAIVADTGGLTPADIAGAITKHSVRLAFFDGRRKVGQRDIDKAFLEQQSGLEMPVEEMEEEQRSFIAHHEAGHAVAQYYVMPDQKIVRLTIVRLSDGSLGHMMPVDTVEQYDHSLMRYAYEIIVALAGQTSVKILTGELHTGVGGDYPMARMYMWRLVENGFFGPPIFGGPFGDSWGQYAHNNEKTLERYWLKMDEATEKLLRRHWKEVTALAAALLDKKTLSGKEVVEIIEANQTDDALKEETIVPKTLAAMRAQALAEIRNNGNGRYLSQPRQTVIAPEDAASGSQSAAGDALFAGKPQQEEEQPEEEEVVVLNGSSNGPRGPDLVNDGRSGYTPSEVERD